MELEDVLADDVEGRRPEAPGQVLAGPGVAERGVVVEQRVEPDVEHVTLVPGHGHAPLQALARERHILQARGDERAGLVEMAPGHDEVRVLGVQALERLLERRPVSYTHLTLPTK